MKAAILEILMRRSVILTILLTLIMAVLLVTLAADVQALPEYSSQTGEPCASCHISPSGGGPRGPRGQAWVGSGKPGEVPDTVQALEILGVHLEVDHSAYLPSSEVIQPSAPLKRTSSELRALYQWLSDYQGN